MVCSDDGMLLVLGRTFCNCYRRFLNLGIAKKGSDPCQDFSGGFDKLYKSQPKMIMDPNSALWLQELLSELIMEPFLDYDFDGVYVDTMA